MPPWFWTLSLAFASAAPAASALATCAWCSASGSPSRTATAAKVGAERATSARTALSGQRGFTAWKEPVRRPDCWRPLPQGAAPPDRRPPTRAPDRLGGDEDRRRAAQRRGVHVERLGRGAREAHAREPAGRVHARARDDLDAGGMDAHPTDRRRADDEEHVGGGRVRHALDRP